MMGTPATEAEVPAPAEETPVVEPEVVPAPAMPEVPLPGEIPPELLALVADVIARGGI